uniref:Uncharacterized protein n=1 Tax=Human herpesvirus 2 TaxID=10310 RepID=A0A481TC12_HHV2|nr:hypothetical protein [Human alphaherpesvirus 2]QBH82876.1 hypothetical protein [Human alphaherpesvirus 2]
MLPCWCRSGTAPRRHSSTRSNSAASCTWVCCG